MSAISYQITGVSFVCSAVCSGADQRKRQISSSLAFVRGIQRWPDDSPHKGPVTRSFTMLPFDAGHHHEIFSLSFMSICLHIMLEECSNVSLSVSAWELPVTQNLRQNIFGDKWICWTFMMNIMSADGMAPEGCRSLIGKILTSFLRIISSNTICQYAGMGNNMTENDLLWHWFEGLNILRHLVSYWFEAAELLVHYWSICGLAVYATPFVGTIAYIGHLLTLVIASVEIKTRYRKKIDMM